MRNYATNDHLSLRNSTQEHLAVYPGRVVKHVRGREIRQFEELLVVQVQLLSPLKFLGLLLPLLLVLPGGCRQIINLLPFGDRGFCEAKTVGLCHWASWAAR